MAHSALNARGKRTVVRTKRTNTAPGQGNTDSNLDIEDAVEGTGFWTEDGVSSQFFVRPCRKRFDLYHVSATPPSPQWHHESVQLTELAGLVVAREERKGR